jgi:hypothetical protein
MFYLYYLLSSLARCSFGHLCGASSYKKPWLDEEHIGVCFMASIRLVAINNIPILNETQAKPSTSSSLF